jgi:aryl-alcohol dehydrogenase-like predicted oxidoreductase
MIHHCDRVGAPRPLLAQQIYNLLVRQLDVEYLAFARQYGVHTSVYNPLAGGLLGRPPSDLPAAGSRFDDNEMYQRRYWSQAMLQRAADYRRLASELGLPLADFALAWLAAQSDIGSIVLGPASVAQLEQAVNAVSHRLPEATLATVDAMHLGHQGTDARYARL